MTSRGNAGESIFLDGYDRGLVSHAARARCRAGRVAPLRVLPDGHPLPSRCASRPRCARERNAAAEGPLRATIQRAPRSQGSPVRSAGITPSPVRTEAHAIKSPPTAPSIRLRQGSAETLRIGLGAVIEPLRGWRALRGFWPIWASLASSVMEVDRRQKGTVSSSRPASETSPFGDRRLRHSSPSRRSQNARVGYRRCLTPNAPSADRRLRICPLQRGRSRARRGRSGHRNARPSGCAPAKHTRCREQPNGRCRDTRKLVDNVVLAQVHERERHCCHVGECQSAKRTASPQCHGDDQSHGEVQRRHGRKRVGAGDA